MASWTQGVGVGRAKRLGEGRVRRFRNFPGLVLSVHVASLKLKMKRTNTHEFLCGLRRIWEDIDRWLLNNLAIDSLMDVLKTSESKMVLCTLLL